MPPYLKPPESLFRRRCPLSVIKVLRWMKLLKRASHVPPRNWEPTIHLSGWLKTVKVVET